jgi:hypothetical protein
MRMFLALAALVGCAASVGAQPTPATIQTDFATLQTAAAKTATDTTAGAATAAALAAAQAANAASAAAIATDQTAQQAALAQLIADLNAVYGTPMSRRIASATPNTASVQTISAAEYAALTGSSGACSNGSCAAPATRHGIFRRR